MISDKNSDGIVARADKYAAFRHMSFRRYWSARFLSTFALQMITVSVGWQLYDLTRDPLDLGIIGLCVFAPSLFLVLITGSVADRYGRRLIMGLAECLLALVALALLYLSATGQITRHWVFALMVLQGIARAFLAPSSAALFANVVPPQSFANAVSWNSSAWQLATIVGPVMGGLIYGLSAGLVYGLAAAMLAFSVVLVFAIPKPHQKIEKQPNTRETIFAGFRFIRSEPVVLGAISLDLFAVLLGGVVALLPVFARDVLDLGPLGLGMMRAAPGVGAIGVALLLATYPIERHAGHIMFVCVALFGVFTMIFGLSVTPWISILALVGLGASDMVSVYVRETLIQLWTPDDVRGRVNAVNMLFIGASNELGEFRAGTMAALIGVVPAVVFGGVGSIIVAGLWAKIFPALRQSQHLRGRDG